MRDNDKKSYFVSLKHGLIQEMRGESGEFEVKLDDTGLSELQGRLQELEREDEYAFRRTFVPYKSADHDDAANQFDDKTVRLYRFLWEHGTEETRRMIVSLNVLPKLENTGYHDKGYGEDGSPTNK
ncbi:hypothetical protein [Paenibacillus rhizophilus]|nr:hypothetical protein [Paenibacillus rhizophilus]